MLFKKLVEYSDKIRKVSARNDKIDIIVELLKKLKREEAEIGVNFISSRVRQGKLNLRWKGPSDLLDTTLTQ